MKIYQMDRAVMKYVALEDCGDLVPFTEAPLLKQIFLTAEKLKPNERMFLVFSKEEKRQIVQYAEQSVGGLETDRGNGHVDRGLDLLFSSLLTRRGLFFSGIPADLDANMQDFSKVDWLLAIEKD